MEDFHIDIINQLKKFRAEKIDPYMEKDDHEGVFRKDIVTDLGSLGLAGITVSSQYGGAELGVYEQCLVFKEIAKSSVPYAVTMSVSAMVQSIIEEWGNEDQKQKYLPELTSGQEIGSFSLSESGAGSDAASLKCSATKTEGGYLLNGSKLWVTTGGESKTYIVFARSENAKVSAFIVQKGAKGFNFGKKESKMGWKTSPTRELIFDNCFIPEEDLISKEGNGLKIAFSGLDKGRLSIAAISVGLSERASEEALAYSLERQQFGKPIFEFQGLQFMLADMFTETQSSEDLVFNAAEMFDQGQNVSILCSMAKLKASDVAMKVTTDAVQIFGGVGYTTEFPVERFMRDAKVLQIVEGTNQIQRVVIARELRKRLGK